MTSVQLATGLRFEPPGPGSWELDAVHFPRPVTRYYAEMHPEPFARGFRPAHHDLPRCVGVGHSDLAVFPGLLNDLVHLLVGEADHGAHPALDPALLHDPAALAHEAQGRLEVDGLGGDRRRVLAGGMAGDLERHELDALPRRFRAERLQVGHRGGQDRRLCVHGAVQLLRRAIGRR